MPIREFSDAELLERACLRVAVFMRGMWEEKDSSDTRLLIDPWIPDRLTIVGRSRRCNGKGHREHVVPRVHIANEVHRMFKAGVDDKAVAAYIRDHIRVVEISKEEAQRLDHQLGLKKHMPDGWIAGGDVFARLDAAGIEWTPIAV